MNYLYNVATNKEVLVTIRVAENVREEFKKAAELRGSTMSGLMHQFIIRTIREEKQMSPHVFATKPHLAPVVARIAPANERRDAQRMIDEADSALKTGMPLSKTGSAITADKMTTKHKRRTG